MFEMKAVCKGNDSLVSVCQTSKQYMKGWDGCLTLFVSHTPQQRNSKSRRGKESTCCANWKVFIFFLFVPFSQFELRVLQWVGVVWWLWTSYCGFQLLDAMVVVM